MAERQAEGRARALLIVGVHRSGTSALARVLNLLGVELGSQLLPAEPDINARGFWESERVLALHDQLLERLGVRWDDALSLPERWWTRPDVAALRDALAAVLREDFEGEAWWGVKDPRLCRLIPLWELLAKDLRAEPACAFIVRSPHEVADSLARRDGLEAVHSDKLWLEHMLTAERDSRELPRAFVTYSDLLDDWRGCTATLAKRLGVTWPHEASEVETAVEAFLSNTLRHHREPDEAVERDPELSRWVKELYRALLAAAATGDETLLRDTADRLREEVAAAEQLYAPALVRAQNALLETEQELRDAREEARLKQVDIELQERRIEELKDHAAEQERMLHQQAERSVEKIDAAQTDARNARGWALTQQTEIERLRGIIELRNSRIEDLQREVGRRGGEALSRWAELNQARHEVIQARGHLVVSQDAVVEAQREIAAARQGAEAARQDADAARADAAQARGEADAARAEAAAHLDWAHREVDAIQRSMTYRLTRPMRAVWHRLRGRRHDAPLPTSEVSAPAPGPAPEGEDTSEVQPPAAPPLCAPEPASPLDFALPACEVPAVSILIPVHGKLDYTIACLRAIAVTESRLPYEVIVIDDASTDDTPGLADRVANLRLLRSEENRGFVHSCNAGAAEARGEYLLFLNNDTEVTAGWLDGLHDVFERSSDAGIVGAKLLDSQGGLQEAGGIIWSDGTGWNYGRGKDHGRPPYNFVRPVDYVSGACLMVPRALFHELGGFDPRFAPAYYEDVDLCFAAREAGKRVYYTPRAVVIHHEGVSHGTDISSGVKRYQEVNREKFCDKWREALVHQHSPESPVEVARTHGVGRKVLVVDARTPILDNDAGSLRMFRLVEILARLGCDVTFTGEFPFFIEGSTQKLQDSGVEALYDCPELASLEQHLASAGEHYDTVILSRYYVARNWTTMVRDYCPKARIILDTVDLHFVRERREADVAGWDEREAALVHIRYEELAAVANVDLTLVVSEEEKTLLAEEVPAAQVDVLPTIHRLRENGPGIADREGLLFIGHFQHPPNSDAIEYYAKEIEPLVQQRLPGVVLTVIGADAPEHLTQQASDTLRFVGQVGDLDPYFDGARLSIAPLRYGAGVKGKILTSMSLGLPVVTTPVGAEGLGVEDGVHVAVGADPVAFADAVERVYRDESVWQQLVKGGLEAVESRFSYEVAEEVLRRVMRIGEDGTRLDNAPLTDAQRRLHRELEFYDEDEDVHALPEIYHYWSNTYLRPVLDGCGIRGINEFFLDAILEKCRELSDRRVDIASIGAGNGDVEVWLARHLRDEGVENFRFQCLELNPRMIERGRALAENEGVADYMDFQEVNLEEWKADRAYPIVIANHSLHHIVGLERLFDEVKSAIEDDGWFVVNDMIGRNGHMMWPEALALVEEAWAEMPDRYKFNHAMRRFDADYVNWDCSTEHNEGIRAQDILPLLLERFHFDLFCGFAGMIDVFVGRLYGHNLDREREEDVAFIDHLARLDEAKLDAGELTPTHMLAILRGTPGEACRCYRDRTPELSVRDPER